MGLNLISAAVGSTAAPLGLSFATQALSRALSAQARLQQTPSSPGSTIPFLRRSATQVSNLSRQGQDLAAQVARFSSASATFDTTADLVTELTSLASQAVGADAATRATLDAAAQNIIGTIFDDLSAQRSALSEFVIPTAINGGSNANNVVLQNVAINSTSTRIPDGGLTVDVDVLGATVGTARRAGSRAIRGNGIRNNGTPGQLDNITEFNIAGNRGSANFLFAAGTQISDALDAINAERLNTGVEGYLDGAGNIDLYSIDFGSDATVTLTEIQNGGQLIGGSVTGFNARATFTLSTGESITVEGEGRNFQFELGGFDFDIDFITSLNESTGGSFLTEGGGANLNNRGFTIFEGGSQIDPTQQYGERLAIPELQAASLGSDLGGLVRIDLENDPGRALEILDSVATDVATGREKIDNALTTLTNRLQGTVDSAVTLESGIQNFETLNDLVDSFGVLRAQSAADSSTALVSQVAQLYPSLLNLFATNR